MTQTQTPPIYLYNQKSVCDCSRRNETKDRVKLGQLLYEVYTMLDAEAYNRSI